MFAPVQIIRLNLKNSVFRYVLILSPPRKPERNHWMCTSSWKTWWRLRLPSRYPSFCFDLDVYNYSRNDAEMILHASRACKLLIRNILLFFNLELFECMNEWVVWIWRFDLCGTYSEIDFYSWRINPMSSDMTLIVTFLCFDNVWIALIWPSRLTRRDKPVIYLSVYLCIKGRESHCSNSKCYFFR